MRLPIFEFEYRFADCGIHSVYASLVEELAGGILSRPSNAASRTGQMRDGNTATSDTVTMSIGQNRRKAFFLCRLVPAVQGVGVRMPGNCYPMDTSAASGRIGMC